MLKITPNRLTLLRIFLLPLPCVLLFGGPESKLTAVGLGSLLGFTDYLDGRLARRKGSSRLGTLLDPIADKIFVSVAYLLLYRLGYLPFWPVFLVVAREILISVLRGLFPEKLRVWSLGRIKTVFQMVGAGLIIIVSNFLSSPLRESTLYGITFLVPALTWFSAYPYLREGLRELLRRPRLFWTAGYRLLLPLGLLVLFPKAGALWPLTLIALAACFLLEVLRMYYRSLF